MPAEKDELVDVFSGGETLAFCAVFFALGFLTCCNALVEPLK